MWHNGVNTIWFRLEADASVCLCDLLGGGVFEVNTSDLQLYVGGRGRQSTPNLISIKPLTLTPLLVSAAVFGFSFCARISKRGGLF